jgi:hypothetical protein
VEAPRGRSTGTCFIPARTLQEQRQERGQTLLGIGVSGRRRLRAAIPAVSRVVPSQRRGDDARAPSCPMPSKSAALTRRREAREVRSVHGGTGARADHEAEDRRLRLNWQHCADITTFPSHSYEQYYQGVRRCWRYGQRRPVTVDIISTEGEADVMGNLQRKAEAAARMFDEMVKPRWAQALTPCAGGSDAAGMRPSNYPAWLPSSPRRSVVTSDITERRTRFTSATPVS